MDLMKGEMLKQPSIALQVVQQPCAATFAEPTAEEFKKWFPGLAISKTTCPDPR